MTVLPAEEKVFKGEFCPDVTGKKQPIPQDEEDDDYEDEKPDSLCCLEGCLTGTIAAFLFLFVIPAGIIFCVYARNTNSQTILAVGITLIVAPIISVPIFLVVVLNRRRLKKLGKNQVSTVAGTEGGNGGAKEPVKY